MIVERFIVPPLDNNVYLVVDEESHKAAIIDTAQGAEILQKRIKELNIDVIFILNTHGHFDHIIDNKLLQTITGAKLAIHELDAYRLVNNPYRENIVPPTVDVFLHDGDIINIGNIQMEVIHTPGHSEGSSCFYIPKEYILFSGDTLFEGSCGRVDLIGSDQNKMTDSLNRLAKLPKNIKVYPGHGYPTTLGDESWIKDQNFIKWILRR